MSLDARYPSLKDRVVLVTGGGSGIGASVVEHFCDQGARVSFIDINQSASESLVARIATKGQPALHPGRPEGHPRASGGDRPRRPGGRSDPGARQQRGQ